MIAIRRFNVAAEVKRRVINSSSSCHLFSRGQQQSLSSAAAATAPTSFDSVQDEIDDANHRYSSILEISSTADRGRGLFASKPFQVGDLVMSATARSISASRDSHSVQTGWDTHATMDLPARFINHSCHANVGVRDNDKGAFAFFAVEEIDEGGELLLDYETFEYEIGSMDACLCGTERCRKTLPGFKESGETIKNLYGEHIANYLK